MTTNPQMKRNVLVDGLHTTEIIKILHNDLGTDGIKAGLQKAAKIIELSVDPIAGPPAEASDGLLYGRIQSGKTSIMSIAAAIAADNGFQCILILTTDNDPLYDQTLERIRAALRGLSVLGKRDWKDAARFERQLRTTPFAIVCSKNGSMLQSLLDAFKNARAKGLSVLIFDDEADQASLNTFLVAASARVIQRPTDSFAFLCHVRMSKRDHAFIVTLIDSFKEDTISTFQKPGTSKYRAQLKNLQEVYDDLSTTEPNLPSFDKIIEKVEFYIKGANIKLVNASSNDEIKLDSVFNLFVGGNKLGRGVTIKNLLVSYYGRNPRIPNADTVLQHARMYGYRHRDLGVTRLFLPQRLADHYTPIHHMETMLLDLIQKHSDDYFEGIYIPGAWQPTRRNILDPTSLGLYVAGSSYNPAYPLRTPSVRKNTAWLDTQLATAKDGQFETTTVDRVLELLEKCEHDPAHGAQLWNRDTIRAALEMQKKKSGNKAYLLVQRNRNLTQPRRETQGILTGGEDQLVPRDAVTLFLFRQDATPKGEIEVCWPQLRFPDGTYAFAFSFDW